MRILCFKTASPDLQPVSRVPAILAACAGSRAQSVPAAHAARAAPLHPPCACPRPTTGARTPPAGPALSPSCFEGLSTFVLKAWVLEKETELRSSWSFREEAEMSLMSTAVVLVNLSVNLLLKGGFISCLGQYSPHAGADLLILTSPHTKAILVFPRPAASFFQHF